MRRALQRRRRRASAVRACGSAELAAAVARHVLCVLLIVGRQPDARKQAVQPQRLRLGRRHGRPGPLLGGRCCGRDGLRCGRAPACDHRGLLACARALHGSGCVWDGLQRSCGCVADAHFGGGPRLGCRSHCQARRRGWSSAQNRLRPCTEPNSSLDWGGQEHRAYPCTAAAEKCVRVQDVCLHALYHRERRVASTSGSAGLLHSAHTVAPCTSYPPCTSDALEQGMGYEVDNRRRARVGRGPGAERAARQAGRARARRRRPGRQRALELREPRTRRSLRRGAVRGGGRGLERLAAWRERRSLVGGTAAAAYCLWRCSQGSGKQGMPCAGHASAACAHTSLEKPDSVHSHPARQQRWLGQATWVTAVHAALTGHRAGRGRHPRTRSQAEDPHHLQRQCAVPAWAHLGRRAAQQGRPHAAWHACMPQPLFRPEARQGRPAQAVIA